MLDTATQQRFVKCFLARDVEQAFEIIELHPVNATGYQFSANPLLVACVDANNGHCYQAEHVQIANRLIPQIVLDLRQALFDDDTETVAQMLQSEPELVRAEFIGRGIAQPIHHFQSIEMGQRLIHAGAKLTALTTRGESPVQMQMRFGTVAGLRLLLENGADPNHGRGGHMPSDLMVEMIELLLDHGWDIHAHHQMLHDANHGHGQRIKTWLKFGVDPNVSDSDGQTALHLIAKRGTGKAAIEALVDSGAKLDAKNANGDTPLDLANRAKRKTASTLLAGRCE